MDGLENINTYRVHSGIKTFWSVLAVLGILLFLAFLVNKYKFLPAAAPNSYHIAEDKNWFKIHPHDKASSISAFSNQLLGAIAAEQGIQISLYADNITNLQAVLEEGEYDAVLTAITPTNKNLDSFLFSDPIYLLGPVLVVRADADIGDLHQMEGKIVGVMSGSSLLFDVDRYPSLILKTYENPQQALLSLDRDLIDGVLLDFLHAYIYTKGLYAEKLKVVTPPLNDAGLQLITRKTAVGQELINDFNGGLKEIKASGIYDELVRKWDLYPQ